MDGMKYISCSIPAPMSTMRYPTAERQSDRKIAPVDTIKVPEAKPYEDPNIQIMKFRCSLWRSICHFHPRDYKYKF